MKEELYQQCILCRGARVTVSWIPIQYADKNKVLQLKTENGWEDGWTVVTQFGTKLTREQLDFKAQQYKNTRKASDA